MPKECDRCGVVPQTLIGLGEGMYCRACHDKLDREAPLRATESELRPMIRAVANAKQEIRAGQPLLAYGHLQTAEDVIFCWLGDDGGVEP